MIADLVEFVNQPRTASEYANLHLPGYSATKVGVFKRLYKNRVKRQRRQCGGGYVFSFWDLPSQWQNAIMVYFMRKDQPKEAIHQEISQKEIDAILYAASTMDERFALEWSKREKHLDAVHKKIIDLIVACGDRRDNGF
jgi:hypothetical protein